MTQLILIFLLTLIPLVGCFYYYKLTKQIQQQKVEISKLNDNQNQLYTILEQEFRKPILTFRDVSQKIDFLVTHGEYDTLRKLGHQLDVEAGELKLLLENLLTWSKSNKGDHKYDPQPLPIKLIIEQIEETFAPLAKEKSILLSTNFDEAAHISVDYDALFLVLKSIIYQIIKSSKHQEALVIDISTPAKVVDIAISSKAISLNLFDEYGTGSKKSGIFNPTFIKELIHLNRGSLQVSKSPSHIPTIHCSFPRA